MKVILLLCLALLIAPALMAAQDRLDLNETTILGNRELPKVTYVIPWRDITVEAPDWQVVRTIGEEPAPLDREVFRRYVEYLESLKDKKVQGNPAPK